MRPVGEVALPGWPALAIEATFPDAAFFRAGPCAAPFGRSRHTRDAFPGNRYHVGLTPRRSPRHWPVGEPATSHRAISPPALELGFPIHRVRVAADCHNFAESYPPGATPASP